MKKIYLGLFLAVLVFTSYFRFSAVKNNNFPITFDQGRDLIDIRSIAVGHKLRLIGPTTSINGVYLGPFWYYFNLVPFIAGGGDPAALMNWQIVWYQLAGIMIYLLIRKSDQSLAFFTSVFFLLMPLGFNTSRYFWNANAMPIFTVFFLLSLFLFKRKQSNFSALLVGLLAGLAFQIEAAFGIIFFPFSFLYLLSLNRRIKVHLSHLAGFVITLLPQMFFELRHQFPLTKVFLSELEGKSTLLGEKLSFMERFQDRKEKILVLISQISHLSPNYFFPIFVILILLLLFAAKRKTLSRAVSDFFSINILFTFFVSVFYLVFNKELKDWYLLGFSVPLIFLYATGLSYVFSLKHILAKILVVTILVISVSATYTAQSEYLTVSSKMGANNKSNLNNSLTVVDWVYQHAKAEGFRVYSYLPAIYDYSYQYLFWWHGNRNYHYRANDVSYLPNQPEYIDNMRSYFTNTRPLPGNEPTFLIIEKEESNPSFQTAWLGNFSKLCQVDGTKYDFGVEIREMVKCDKK